MAKYKTKSSNTGKIIIALLLILAIVAGVLCCGYASRTDEGWFRNSDLKTWHWNDPSEEPENPDKPENPENPVTPSTVGNVIVEDIGESEISLASYTITAAEFADYGLESHAEGGQVISVTNVNDSYTYQWTLSGDGSTYIEMSNTSGTSISFAAKQAFGTPITLTCRAAVDDIIVSQATCTIGYKKRPISATVNGETITNGSTVELTSLTDKTTLKEICQELYIEFDPQYSVGTVDSDVTDWFISVSVTSSSQLRGYQGCSVSFAEAYLRACAVVGNLNVTDDLIASTLNGTYAGIEQTYSNWLFTMADKTLTFTFGYGAFGDIFTFNIHLSTSLVSESYNISLSQDNVIL